MLGLRPSTPPTGRRSHGPGRPPIDVPVRSPGGRQRVPVLGSVSNSLGAGVAAGLWLPICHLPAVHGTQSPSARASTTSGLDGRQAQLTRVGSTSRRPATPARFRARSPAPRVTGTEHRERAPVSGRHADRQPLGGGDQRRIGEPRPVLGRRAARRRGRGPRASADHADRAGDGGRGPPASPPCRAHAAAGGPAPEPERPSGSGSSTRSNRATAAAWLRSAASAAARIADGSSGSPLAVAGSAPASCARSSGRRATGHWRPADPRNGNSGVASARIDHVSTAAAMTEVLVACWR